MPIVHPTQSRDLHSRSLCSSIESGEIQSLTDTSYATNKSRKSANTFTGTHCSLDNVPAHPGAESAISCKGNRGLLDIIAH